MDVKIYQPAKNAMQSGIGNTKKWVLEFEPVAAVKPEELMGWVGGGNTRNQLRMKFATKEDAIRFAERKGLGYQVIEPHKRRVRPKNYADNFAFNRVG